MNEVEKRVREIAAADEWTGELAMALEWRSDVRVLLSRLAGTLRSAVKILDERDEDIARLRRILWDIRTELYGKGFEVLGWHQNGDTEPLDNWFENNEGWLDESVTN